MQPQKNPRPWRIVASEAALERDSQKLMTLLAELNDALEEQGMVKADGKNRSEDGQ